MTYSNSLKPIFLLLFSQLACAGENQSAIFTAEDSNATILVVSNTTNNQTDMTTLAESMATDQYVEVVANAEGPSANITEHLAETRTEIKAWKRCASIERYGDVEKIAGFCDIKANINGFDGYCKAAYWCKDGEPQNRFFSEEMSSRESRDLEYAKKLTQKNSDSKAIARCSDNHDIYREYGYWNYYEDLYHYWHVTYHGIYVCIETL